jgi:hypothetical protein
VPLDLDRDVERTSPTRASCERSAK